MRHAKDYFTPHPLSPSSLTTSHLPIVCSPGGYSQKNWAGVCGPLPKTLTLSMTKICDFPYPIYDLTKHLTPYL